MLYHIYQYCCNETSLVCDISPNSPLINNLPVRTMLILVCQPVSLNLLLLRKQLQMLNSSFVLQVFTGHESVLWLGTKSNLQGMGIVCQENMEICHSGLFIMQ